MPLRITLLLTISLLPLVGAFGSSDFEQTKVFIFLILNTLSALFWLFYLIKTPKTFHWSPPKTLALIFIGALLLTSLTGLDPQTSLLGRAPYLQGWGFYFEAFLFFLMVSSIKIELKTWALSLSLSSIGVSLLAIIQFIQLTFLHQSILTYSGRVISSFGQPNFYSGFLLLILPLSFSLLKQKDWSRRLGALSLVLSTLGILVSYSRASILLMVALFIFYLSTKTQHLKTTLLYCFLIIFSAILLSYETSSGLIYKELSAPLSTDWQNYNWSIFSPEKRVFILPVVGEQALKRPLLGYGLENLNLAWESYHKENSQKSPVYYELKDILVDRSHNYPLDLLIFSGLLGLLTWLILNFLLLRKAKGVLLLSILTYLIFIQFQNQSAVQLIFFFFLTGLIDQTSLTAQSPDATITLD